MLLTPGVSDLFSVKGQVVRAAGFADHSPSAWPGGRKAARTSGRGSVPTALASTGSRIWPRAVVRSPGWT